MTQQTVDIAIIGAGPVGAALALNLAGAGRSVLLVDRAALPPMEHPDFDGRAYAIAAGSRELLDGAGLWDALPFDPCPIEQIRVSDGKPGRPASPLHLHFDHRDVGDAPFGWIVEARALRMAINRRLAESGIVLHAPAQATVVRHADHAEIAVAGQETYRAALVVAADGRASTLRAQAGIPVTKFAYRQSAVVCAIAHERSHRNVALEHFLPGGPFAQLPMSDADGAHISAIVFTEAHEVAQRLGRWMRGRSRRRWRGGSATIWAGCGWSGGGGPTRSRRCMRIAIMRAGWRWSGIPRTGFTRSPVRGSILACAMVSRWPG
jgi:2-octaprenyl-6-methoxyphenol hydroxylase (EC 1.14.13.-)/2-octaprenyl-3-methyl-6-methoxy-1,4-benzoquinol hydroxylase (EC 1.14.13.-)